MKLGVLAAALSATFIASTCIAFAQDTSQDDSNAKNQSKWPLAAKAGVDSHALTTPLPGAVNKGVYSDKSWIRGHNTDPPPGGSPIWNPVKVKMMQGGKITGVTVPADSDPTVYCQAANSGVDYIWTEVQHGIGSWSNIYDEWSACPHAKAVPGARVPNANEMDEQHAMDNGALVLNSDRAVGGGSEGSRQMGILSADGRAESGRQQPRLLGRRAGRLSQDHQRQSRVDPDDRDA